MTNNDELAIKLKAAAEKASGGEWVRESGEGWEAICSDDDQVNGGFIICSFQGNDDESNRKFVQGASPANILALLAERDADKALIAELTNENSSLKKSVENAAGCINAAYSEGLIDVLAESCDERLVDLVKRRLLHAHFPVETPATDAELIAVGDWVLREQLEDGTRFIARQSEILNNNNQLISELRQRIAELEIESSVKDASILELKQQYQRLLEARPVTVKLPPTMYTEFEGDDYCREVAVLDKQQVIDALSAAGITLDVGE